MTAAPIVPGPHDGVAATAAEALAAILPASEQLECGTPQPGTEHVTAIFAWAVIADLGGAVSGRVGVLVSEELTAALSSSPMGQLDLAAAVQPALDAAAAALGGTAQAGRTVALEDVVADMGGDFTAVPLLGSTIQIDRVLVDKVFVDTAVLRAISKEPLSLPQSDKNLHLGDLDVRDVSARIAREDGSVTEVDGLTIKASADIDKQNNTTKAKLDKLALDASITRPDGTKIRIADLSLDLTADCPRGCTHAESEPECALDEAVAAGTVEPARVGSYRRLLGSRARSII